MDGITVKIKTTINEWQKTEDFIKKISATHSGNCKLRIVAEVIASEEILGIMSGMPVLPSYSSDKINMNDV